jgi:hypothetical protein|tara:strand:- start:1673 stop:2032 length:360 start_codon:yes stop_codon:yes gene_type:complete
MAQLSTKLKLYCEANSKTANFGDGGNIILQDDSDGKGPYIKSWTVDGLAKPDDSKIAEYETAGNKEETNNGVRATRKSKYGEIGDQLDMLYKDMLADKGDKTGDWFKHIKDIKDANPKS